MRKCEYEEGYIRDQIFAVSVAINLTYRDIEEPLVIIPILNGGVFFYVDLVRYLKCPNKMGTILTSKYANGYPTDQKFSIKFMDADVRGKDVLLVDEICFTGETLQKTKEVLLEVHGAREVKTVALIDHVRPGRVHEPDFAAITYKGDKWLYGYGMDIQGLNRNLTEIVYDDK